VHVLSLVRLTAFAHTVGPLRVGRSVTGKSAQGRCLLHRYGLVVHLNPAASLKPAQRGVDALPGTSHPVREFFLRHLLADYAIIVPGLAKQRLRDTARQVQEYEVGRFFGKPPQADRKRTRQGLGDRRRPPVQIKLVGGLDERHRRRQQ
jgi:hypothetical protein